MRVKFLDLKLQERKLTVIRWANEIIGEYQEQGYALTLRQLYYQFVSRSLLQNSEQSYNLLGTAVSDGRLCGLVDWDAIEDRIRQPRAPTEFQSLTHLVEAALESYRLPRWSGQDYYCELWVEKDALAGVLEPLAKQFHVTLMVNRGYSSTTAMYDAAARFKEHRQRYQQQGVILYLGDHDPSGEDMVRDIRDRFKVFGMSPIVAKLALTIDQVSQYALPPNWAKVTDSRAKAYIAKYGPHSWEVDALPPNILQRLVRQSFERNINMKKMGAIVAQEERDKTALRNAAQALAL